VVVTLKEEDMDRAEEGAERGLLALPLFGDAVGCNAQAMRSCKTAQPKPSSR